MYVCVSFDCAPVPLHVYVCVTLSIALTFLHLQFSVSDCKASRWNNRLEAKSSENYSGKIEQRGPYLTVTQVHSGFDSVFTFTLGWITFIFLSTALCMSFLSLFCLCFSFSHIMTSIPQWATVKSNSRSAGVSSIPQRCHSSLHQGPHCLRRQDQRKY